MHTLCVTSEKICSCTPRHCFRCLANGQFSLNMCTTPTKNNQEGQSIWHHSIPTAKLTVRMSGLNINMLYRKPICDFLFDDNCNVYQICHHFKDIHSQNL